jgi:uncharacterized protein (UPF0128 family)
MDENGQWRPVEVFVMQAMKQWKADIFIGEKDGHTYAEAWLVTEIGDRLVGVGMADVGPHDADIPEIGDELAVARALRNLGTQLLDQSSVDIQGVTREDVHLSH